MKKRRVETNIPSSISLFNQGDQWRGDSLALIAFFFPGKEDEKMKREGGTNKGGASRASPATKSLGDGSADRKPAPRNQSRNIDTDVVDPAEYHGRSDCS